MKIRRRQPDTAAAPPPLSERRLGLPEGLQEEPTNRFTVAWVVALLAVAAIAVAGTLLTDWALQLQRDAIAVVTEVSTQRERLDDLHDEVDRVILRPGTSATDTADALSTILVGLRQDHTDIVAGDPDGAVPAPNGADALIQADALEARFTDLETSILTVVTGLEDLPRGVTRDEILDAVGTDIERLDGQSGEYRLALAGMADLLTDQANERSRDVRAIEGSMLLATLALLVVEALLIFRPATRRMREILESRRRLAEDERARTKQQLEMLARYDHLTGLANRMMFRDRLDHAVNAAERSGKRVALMFLDLDKFKDINDQLGHDAGDELLIEVAERLQAVARRADTIARLGGDEFTLILEGLDSPDGAATVADKLLEVMEQPVDLAGRQVKVTTSIGIAVYPDDAANVEDLLRHADSAMYQAKGAGRNTFQFSTPELREANVKRLEMISDLRTAVAKQRLRLVYQPQVNLHSSEVIGVEALVRWVQPDGTEVPAGDFIEVAEDTDLMGPLGEWVLEEACRQNVEWQRAGMPPIRVAINLSSRQFRQLNLATSIATALNDTGMDPHLLELEITEQSLTEDVDTSAATLRLLKGIGVRLVIDDFGTGYSSLGYLKRFPIDSLKIDGSFIHDGGLEDDSALAAAITGLARHLGMESTAEGVETEEQLAYLRRIGCNRAQGYLVSRPLEPHEVPNFATERRLRVVSDDERGSGSA